MAVDNGSRRSSLSGRSSSSKGMHHDSGLVGIDKFALDDHTMHTTLKGGPDQMVLSCGARHCYQSYSNLFTAGNFPDPKTGAWFHHANGRQSDLRLTTPPHLFRTTEANDGSTLAIICMQGSRQLPQGALDAVQQAKRERWCHPDTIDQVADILLYVIKKELYPPSTTLPRPCSRQSSMAYVAGLKRATTDVTKVVQMFDSGRYMYKGKVVRAVQVGGSWNCSYALRSPLSPAKHSKHSKHSK